MISGLWLRLQHFINYIISYVNLFFIFRNLKIDGCLGGHDDAREKKRIAQKIVKIVGKKFCRKNFSFFPPGGSTYHGDKLARLIEKKQ